MKTQQRQHISNKHNACTIVTSPVYIGSKQKGKTIDFLETIVVYDLKLVTDDRSDMKFLLTSKLCPLGAVCPLRRGYIHVLNHEKTMYKIRLQRDFFETCN